MVIQKLLVLLSYLFTVPLKRVRSEYSGMLYLHFYRGRKILDTDQVNYSFNSLHRVFKKAFKRTGLEKLKIEKILILGLGGGSIVELLRKDYHITAPITALDIDPVVIQLAREEFNIEQYMPIRLVTADAAVFIENNREKFGLVCIDVFIHDTVPGAMLTRESAEYIINSLEKNGRAYFNIMAGEGEKKAEAFLDFFTGNADIKIQVLQVEETNQVWVIEKII